MELVGTNRFDIEDEDWCCDEITDLAVCWEDDWRDKQELEIR